MDSASKTMTTTPLTDRERAVLEFERLAWKYQGARDGEILDRFGWTATRHAQVVAHLIDRPEALAYDAQLVNILRRRRDRRARMRPTRRLGWAD